MVSPSVGKVVLVRFPFSDLSSAKLRPALVLASAGHDDWILCQITGNPYADPKAVKIEDSDFADGGLKRVSYARPSKLFTSNISLIVAVAGTLQKKAHQNVVSSVIEILRSGEVK